MTAFPFGMSPKCSCHYCYHYNVIDRAKLLLVLVKTLVQVKYIYTIAMKIQLANSRPIKPSVVCAYLAL